MLVARWPAIISPAGHERTVTALVAVLVLIVFLAPLTDQVPHTYVGADAHNLDGRWVVTQVDPAGPAAQAGLQVGDIVIAMDDQPPTVQRQTDPGLALELAQRWTVRRGATTLTLERSPIADAWYSIVEPNLMVVLALLFWALATFVCLSKPTDGLARHFGWLNLTMATALALSPAGASDLLWARTLSVFAFGLLPGLSLSFFAWFSQGTPPSGRLKVAVRGLTVAGLVAAVAFLVTGILGSTWQLPCRFVVLGLLAVGWLASLIVLIRAFFRPATPQQHHQRQIVLVGTAVALLPLTLLVLVPISLGLPPLLRPQLAAFSLIALPISFAYAILRYGALEIEFVMERTLVHGVMSLVLASGYGLFYFALSQVGGRSAAPPHPLLVLAFFVGVALTFIPVRNQIHRLVDRALFGARYDHVQTLRALTAQLVSQQPIDRVLTTVADSLAGALDLRGAAIVLRQPDGDLAVRGASASFQDASARSGLVAQAATRGNGRGPGDPAGHPPVASPHDGVWLPLRANGEEIGLLYLGPKRGPGELGQEDRQLAETLANQTALAVANDLLVERLQAQVAELALLRDRLLHVQEAERKKIADDLHDGPLQTVLDLVRRANEASEALPAAAAGQVGRREQLRQLADRGEDVAYELRAVCVELFPPELKHLGLVAALDNLAQRTNREEPLTVTFEHPDFPDDHRLAVECEEALYRAAREAIRNVCRHAGASRVLLTLGHDRERVTLTVEDDGHGFTPPASYGVLLRGGHVGLLSMRERVERLGGLVSLASAPGAGTTVTIVLPTQPDQPAPCAVGASP